MKKPTTYNAHHNIYSERFKTRLLYNEFGLIGYGRLFSDRVIILN